MCSPKYEITSVKINNIETIDSVQAVILRKLVLKLFIMATFIRDNKKRIFAALIAAVELIVIITFIVPCCNGKAQPSTIMWQQEELEGGFYVDSSFDLDKRRIMTPAFPLRKGYYDVTVEYETNLPPEAFFGTTVRLLGKKDKLRFEPDMGHVLLSAGSDTSTLQGYVPYNDSEGQVVIAFPDNEAIPEFLDEARYLIVRSVSVTFDPKKSAVFDLLKVLSCILVIDIIFVVRALWGKIAVKTKH